MAEPLTLLDALKLLDFLNVALVAHALHPSMFYMAEDTGNAPA
jgi:hypothetical protein